MYSFARNTMRWKSSGVVFERGTTSSGPAPPTLPRKRGREGRGRLVERLVERVDDRRQTLDRARQRRLGGDAGLRPNRRHDGDGVLDRVEGDHQRRADEDRLGNADRIGRRRGERILHLPHHVVAEIAEHAGGHRRQAVRQGDAAFGDQGAQRGKRRRSGRRERFRIVLRRPVDLRLRAATAKDDVRLKPDDRIAYCLAKLIEVALIQCLHEEAIAFSPWEFPALRRPAYAATRASATCLDLTLAIYGRFALSVKQRLWPKARQALAEGPPRKRTYIHLPDKSRNRTFGRGQKASFRFAR